ncbi:MAG: hypothetical protein ABI333_23695 [bacterium]
MHESKRRRGAVLWSLLPCLLVPGCAAGAIPALNLTVAGGGVGGKVEPANVGEHKVEHRNDSVVQVRVGVDPLAFSRRWLGRRLDTGVGYLVETHPGVRIDQFGSLVNQGAYVHLTAYPYVRLVRRGRKRLRVMRLAVVSMAEVLRADPWLKDELGIGASLALRLEWVKFFSGPIRSKKFAGIGHGELGIGLYAQGSYRSFPQYHYTVFTAGITFRSPAIAGIGWK